MIAYKTYELCPVELMPYGIPTVLPWVMQECDEEQAHDFRMNGYTVVTNEEYDAYLAEVNDEMTEWLAQKDYLAALNSVNKTILTPAQAFGLKVMNEFASENVLLGITQAGLTGSVLTKTAGIMQAVQSGSLYEVIARAKAIPSSDYDSTFLTAARLLVFINKIEDYLGIPRSTSL